MGSSASELEAFDPSRQSRQLSCWTGQPQCVAIDRTMEQSLSLTNGRKNSRSPQVEMIDSNPGKVMFLSGRVMPSLHRTHAPDAKRSVNTNDAQMAMSTIPLHRSNQGIEWNNSNPNHERWDEWKIDVTMHY